ncbi:class I SAM-dependent methyltransferase [Aeromicrobium sp. CF3.5]|uniref:class I SAM-dependent methyltransferase n=1 Tax=Aeromicrobium sp. CF3.5 TaxID=3373078 RepID=UPI003EE578BA
MTGLSYFENAYSESADPWNLVSEYEQRKYTLTLASLPRQSYASAFEPGCSIGVLTGLLAQRCERIIATDGVAAPLQEVAGRAPSAEVGVGTIPADWPAGSFDLIVLSEVMYYLTAADRRHVLERARDSLLRSGHLLVVHWRHSFEEAECDGDVVHAEVTEFATEVGWSRLVHHVETDFRLEVFGCDAT